MTNRLVYSTILCLFLFEGVQAQNNTKWAIGPDLLGLFNANSLPKYSLYARYKLGDNGAVRVRGGYYNVREQPGIYDEKDQKTYGIRVGYERSKAIYKESLYLIYGAEYIYFWDRTMTIDLNSPFVTQSLLISRHTENGGSAFIGCRYFILPAISVSTESAFQVTQTHIIKTQLGVEEHTYDFTSTILIPITSFNLCFHF